MIRRLLMGIVFVVLAGVSPGAAKAGDTLLLATTTSVRDSGLLDELLPRFATESGIRVRTIAVGTGAALRMGADGNADVLITHAAEREKELLATGTFSQRLPFMENHFVIGGPAEDPARVAQAGDAIEAYRRMARGNVPYVSRSDDSGTHLREKALMTEASLDPEQGWPAILRTGAGMGASLQVAGERRAYLLSDVGTFLAFRERIGLRILSMPSPALRNVYSILLVNPERFPGQIHQEGARTLLRFLSSREVQERIAGFGRERFGRPLFRPLLLEDSPG